MVCIEKRPYTLYGRLAALHFRYLTCLLDRGHIIFCSCFFYCFNAPDVYGSYALLPGCYRLNIMMLLIVHNLHSCKHFQSF